MPTIGTAGHVDHGKSMLVRALTGIDPDRLTEEKARGMTIDLGFAWFTLPDGREVSVVDVPGHEDFIKNMLAGVGGIDAALLVVAADEGVMPQTREHLGILDMLRIEHGVVALTKFDLVDTDWLEMVHLDIVEALEGTALAQSSIIPVSAVTGAGMDHLRDAIAAAIPPAVEDTPWLPPRLPIDRVFTMSGFGTVVTGTLLDSPLAVGMEVELLPQGARGRVRGLQQHKAQTQVAVPGSRVAVNLSGIDRQAARRGMVLTAPGALSVTTRLDVRLESWRHAARALRHNMALDICIGAAVVPAQVKLLNDDSLEPDSAGWAQLLLAQPVAVAPGDRFIARNPSPSETLGGGVVVDTQPRQHRRRQADVSAHLAALTGNDLVARVREVAQAGSRTFDALAVDDIVRQTRLSPEVVRDALDRLRASGDIVPLGDSVIAVKRWLALCQVGREVLEDYHRRFPLRRGMSIAEWRQQARIPDAALAQMQTEGVILMMQHTVGIRTTTLVALPEFSPQMSKAQHGQLQAVIARLAADELNPLAASELELLAPAEVLEAAIADGTLVKIAPDLITLGSAVEHWQTRIVAYLTAHERITVAEARDCIGGSRRLIVPLLEYFDSCQITRRIGDVRMLGMRAMNMAQQPDASLSD